MVRSGIRPSSEGESRTVNKKQLMQLGVPADCVAEAIGCLQTLARDRVMPRGERKATIRRLAESPEAFTDDDYFGPLARAVVQHAKTCGEAGAHEPISYRQWGDDVDKASKQQMENACRLPIAVGAALMPDAHCGYGLPIGGVLACDNAVVPYAVGVDIACRMRLSITDLPVDVLERNDKRQCADLDSALAKGTRFGVGKQWDRPKHHDVLDEDWSVSPVTKRLHDKARKQLGTSGSGNHFAEWGVVELPRSDLDVEPGRYVALLSHSGSRGAGAEVCRHYTDIARRKLPAPYNADKQMQHLAWLSLETQDGQAYWEAMNLMGRYAAANHQIIHRDVLRRAGAEMLAAVENHHNFAWKEEHGGRTLVVHRKGATPAGRGVLGVIPGNMADSAFIIRGRGNAESLHSASHGAGRRMSRTAAKQQFVWKMWRDVLRRRNVRLLAGGIDEVPGVYKNIHEVMRAQTDLVDVVGTFQPRIVMMCGDGSRAED